METIRVILSSAALYTRNKFRTIPAWMWMLQIVCTSFFSMFFFVVLADYVSNPDVTVRYVVIGNVLQSIAATTLYAVSDLPGTEKHVGTLSPLMQTPSNLYSIFIGMSLFNIFAGLISATLSLCYAQFVFDINLTGADMLSAVTVILLTVFSLTGFGMLIGSIGLRLRTSTIIANLFAYVGLLICGVNFPVSYLPEWLQWISAAFPLTYGVDAMRLATDGIGIGGMMYDICLMLGLGMLYFIISMILFRMFENMARRTGSYEMF
ncbi:MAG: ABC transporter permease [Candidatus Methanomethylophilaceae archaeon]|nr:ABC transporter permease [Candidatus Methanomethylophilaceae archaeon]